MLSTNYDLINVPDYCCCVLHLSRIDKESIRIIYSDDFGDNIVILGIQIRISSVLTTI